MGDIWTRQPKELPITVAEVIYMHWVNKNPRRFNQSKESRKIVKKKIVETMCYLRVEFVLTPNPKRNWTQSSKTQQDFERSCE